MKDFSVKVRVFRAAAILGIGCGVMMGAAACSPKEDGAPSSSAASSESSPAAVSSAIQSFFAAATSADIAAAFPDKATEETFAPVLQKMDPSAPAAQTKKAVTDLALLKISDPKAYLAVTVDDSQIRIDGQNATVPVSALSVTSGGTKVGSSDILAAGINNLVFRNGEWIITFLSSGASSDAPTPAPSPSTK